MGQEPSLKCTQNILEISPSQYHVGSGICPPAHWELLIKIHKVEVCEASLRASKPKAKLCSARTLEKNMLKLKVYIWPDVLIDDQSLNQAILSNWNFHDQLYPKKIEANNSQWAYPGRGEDFEAYNDQERWWADTKIKKELICQLYNFGI